MGYTPAALSRQVGGSLVSSPDVVDNDPRTIGDFLDPIEEHDGDLLLDKGSKVIQVFGVEGQGGDEPVYPLVEEVMGVGGFFFIILGGMTYDKIVACLGGDLFNTGQDGADKLAFQLMYDDPDGIGLLAAEVAGEVIGPVAHLPCHIGDAFAGLYIDGGMVFQAPADGGGGEIEHFGDIVDGNVFFRVHAGVRDDFGTNMKLFLPK